MITTEARVNSGVTQQFPPDAYLFQAFLPNLKPDFPLVLPKGIPTIEEAEDIVDDLTATLNQDQLPVNIDAILSYCGVTRISNHSSLVVKGLSRTYGYIGEVGDEYFIVRVNSSDSAEEQVCTKGHELGHRILHETGYPVGQYKRIFASEERGSIEWERRIIERLAVERSCDELGRMVLAPRRLLVPQAQEVDFRNVIRTNDSFRPELSAEIIALFTITQLPPVKFVWRLSELGLLKEDLFWLQGLLQKHLKESN